MPSTGRPRASTAEASGKLGQNDGVSDDLEFPVRMSDSDGLMWQIEKDPLLRSTITAVAILDAVPDRDQLLDKLERGSRLVPRLRQRVVGNMFSMAPPRWEFDPNFDLRYHVRFVRAPGEGTLRDVLDIAEPIAMQGFDRARPLWEFVVVDGLADGKAALIQKLHHAITDGVGGIKISMSMLDFEREPGDPGPMPEAPEAKVWTAGERFADGLGHVYRRNLGMARRSIRTLSSAVNGLLSDPSGTVEELQRTLSSVGRMAAPAGEPLSPVMAGRSLSVHFDTLSMSLADLKAASKAAGGRLNDAFVAGVLGGFARYHEHHGTAPESLRMHMPINIRNEDTANQAGNQFVPARFPVPLDIADPVERMAAVRELVASQRDEPANALAEPLSQVFGRLPTSVTTALFGSMLRGVDLTTSNVPGIPIPVYVAGAQLEAMFPFGPLAGAGVNVTLLSAIDDVHIGVNIDPAAVPDPDVLMACLQDSFAEILKLAAEPTPKPKTTRARTKK
jgi:diacylglycerol O-acyltransferase